MARERYFNSSVLVPLVKLHGEYHFLFQKRAENIRQASEICFPGGKFDPKHDSNFEDTAIRETMEELGIKKDKIQIEGRFDTVVAAMGATVDSFLGTLKISNLNELDINKDEVEKVFTLPVSFFRNTEVEKYKVRLEVQPSYIDKKGNEIMLLPGRELGLPEIYHGPWGGTFHRVLVYKTDEGVIWGITAEIVYEMISKLQST